jgi:hypothetical protein
MSRQLAGSLSAPRNEFSRKKAAEKGQVHQRRVEPHDRMAAPLVMEFAQTLRTGARVTIKMQ